MSRIRFRPGVVPLVAGLIVIVVTSALGTWQLGRAREKGELRARIESSASGPAVTIGAAESESALAALVLRRVEVLGTFDGARTVLLDNRVRDGKAGYEVITPLRVADGDIHVLINRGWIAGGADRSRLPAVPLPRGTVQVTGLAVVPARQVYELSADTVSGAVWQNLTIERYRQKMSVRVHDIVVQQENDLGDGLLRVWPRPDSGIDRHKGYALQWFLLAGLTLVLLLFHGLKSREHDGEK